MGVRKIKDKWVVDFRINGTRKRIQAPVNSKQGAKLYEASILNKIREGFNPFKEKSEDKSTTTFKEFTWEWFEIYVKNNNKPSEIRTKRIILNAHLVPFFGNLRLDEISTFHIEKYKAKKISSGLSNKSINNHLVILSKCLRTAEDWDRLEKLPKIKMLKTPPPEVDYLNKKECEVLLNKASGIWYEMILVVLRTGLRFGELKALVWSDINWESRMLTVKRSIHRNIITTTKSNKQRHIPLTQDLYNVLLPRRQKTGYIFIDKYGKPLKDTVIQYALYSVCRKAGLRKITWHKLRHTFASRLTEKGASMRAIQKLLGHADIQTTMKYAHLAPSELRKTVELLENEKSGHQMGTDPKKFEEILAAITAEKAHIYAKNNKTEDSTSASSNL
jgi:integrase